VRRNKEVHEAPSESTIAATPIRAILFDFDGVVADTEKVHYATFAGTLAEEGIVVTPEEHASDYMGIDDAGCFRLAYRKAGRVASGDDVERLLARKSCRYEDALGEIGIFPGVARVIEEALARGPSTIASCGRRRDIEAVLRHHGLLDRLPPFISADEITRPKPFPDCFLAALELLRKHGSTDLEPQDCLVFEDSIRGVEAAKRAGMRCVAFTHSFPRSALGAADLVLDSWSEWRWPN
jgi:beta-phosphoglucomutase-like phosphatase (HAD superfamily)